MERYSKTADAGIVKIARNGHSSILHIPRPVLHALGWERGGLLRMRIVEGALVFRSLETIIKEGERVVEGLDEKAAAITAKDGPLQRDPRELGYGRRVGLLEP